MESSYITAAAKHLSSVEIDSWKSNQHEFNGVSVLRKMLGDERKYFNASFLYYDRMGMVAKENGVVTWYDAREAHPTRTEYRLYYSENNIIRKANVNDLLIVGKINDNSLVIIIVKNRCSYYDLFMNMFGLSNISNTYVISNRIAV